MLEGEVGAPLDREVADGDAYRDDRFAALQRKGGHVCCGRRSRLVEGTENGEAFMDFAHEATVR